MRDPQRSALPSILFYCSSAVVVRGIGVVVTAILFRSFSVDDLGAYFFISALMGYGMMMVTLGLSQPMLRSVVRGIIDPPVGNVLAFRILAAGGACIVLIVLALSSPLLRSRLLVSCVMFACLLPACVSMEWALMGMGRYRTMSSIQIVSQLMYLGAVTLAARYSSLVGLAGAQFALSFSLSCGIQVAAVAYDRSLMGWLWLRAGQALRTPLRSAFEGVRSQWVYSLVFLFTSLFAGMELAVSGFILPSGDVGLLGALTRCLTTLLALLAILNEILFPLRERGAISGRSVLAFNLAFSLLIFSVFQIGAPVIVSALFGKSLVGATGMFRIYATCLIPASLYFAGVTRVLGAAGEPGFDSKYFVHVFTRTFVVIVMLAIVLPLRFGVDGVVAFSAMKWTVLAATIHAVVKHSGSRES
jgi:O-antigen/teichoic acid export membrane protein